MTRTTVEFRPLRHADLSLVATLLQEADLRGTDIVASGQSASEPPLHWAVEGKDGDGATDTHFPFVAQHETGAIAGFIMLRSTDRWARPLHSFRLGTQAHASYDGNSFAMKTTLTLSNDLVDYAQLGTPLLAAGAPTGTAELLYDGALAHVARFSDRFPAIVVSRLRGYRRPDGGSPFWEGLGKKFVRPRNLPRLDAAGVPMRDYGIAELMPRWPLYLDLLPAALQEVVSLPDASAHEAAALLEQRGFTRSKHIDVIDGGPWMAKWIRDSQAVQDVRAST